MMSAYEIVKNVSSHNSVYKTIRPSQFAQGLTKDKKQMRFDDNADVINMYNRLIKNKQHVKKPEPIVQVAKNNLWSCILFLKDNTSSLLAHDQSKQDVIKNLKNECINKIQISFKEKKNGLKANELKQLMIDDKDHPDMYDYFSSIFTKTIVLIDVDNLARTMYGKPTNEPTIGIIKRGSDYFGIDDVTPKTIASNLYKINEYEGMNYATLCKVYKIIFDEKRCTKKEMLEKINILYL